MRFVEEPTSLAVTDGSSEAAGCAHICSSEPGWRGERPECQRMRAGLMSRMLDAVLPEGSAVRDFVEVGGLLASGVSIALVCSSIGGVVMDTLGFLATLVLFFVAGFFFLTSKARPTPSAPGMLRVCCAACGVA